MTWLAEAFEVRQVIGTTICFGGDVVYRLSGCIPSFSQALLTKMFISVKNDRTQPVPLTPVATLMATLTLLVLLPALIAMLLTVA